MKIVYLMDQMYLHGGAEKIVSLKMNGLSRNFGHEVCLITTNQHQKPYIYNVDSQINIIDLQINYISKKSFFSFINLLKSLKHYYSLRKHLSNLKPDIIISVSQTPDQFFLPFIQKAVPKLKEFHTSGYVRNTQKSSFLKNRLFKIFEKYDKLVVLNQDEKQYYSLKNLEVIPNFIPDENLKGGIEESERKKVILFAGRIAPVKQINHLISAWEMLYRKYPEWSIHVYGDGDLNLTNDLVNLVKIKGIKNIEFKGASSDISFLMKESSILALTSSNECFPMVLLEAMSLGTPVISYDCPHGPRNIIEDGQSGLLVPNGEIIELKKSLDLLIRNDELRLKFSANGLARVKEFREDKVISQWDLLFHSLSNL